ncbi:MAG: MFS transporter [Rubrobacter sp.]
MSVAAERAGARGIDRRGMTGLSFGHLFTDLNQGAVAALIPFLIAERGISLTAAGALILAATVSSSVVQPIFGIFSDKRSLSALMPLGLLLGGVGIALVGVAPNYATIFACIVLSGIGVAAFHPEGARFANYVSVSGGRARGMSYFSVGGNAGFALGPALTTPLILAFGMPGTLLLVLPAALMAAVLFMELPRLATFRPEAAGVGKSSPATTTDAAPGSGWWFAFVRMVAVVVIRSFVYFGLVAFVASYYVQDLGTSAAFGNTALTVMLASGAAGTLLLGGVADRFGRRTVLAGTMLVAGPLVYAFTLSGPIVGAVLLGCVGACLIGTFGITVVMGQEYLPDRIGLAAGISLGLSIGIGGVGATSLGAFADAYGLSNMLLLLAVLPVLGFLLTLTLPKKV